MNEQLKDMFQEQARTERFEVMPSILGCKQQQGGSVSSYVLKLKGYFHRIEHLIYTFTQDLSIDVILNSLISAYK